MDALILAGGKSSRMGGKHKGSLKIGDENFTQRLVSELKPCVENLFLSYGETVQQEICDCHIIQDEYKDCGPMGGIYTGLKFCESEILLVVACDMPLLKWEIFEILQKNLDDCDAVIPIVVGKINPLAAIYRKKIFPVFENCLQEKNYRLRSALEKANVHYINMDIFAKYFQNVNTEEDYFSLIQKI